MYHRPLKLKQYATMANWVGDQPKPKICEALLGVKADAAQLLKEELPGADAASSPTFL
jgi:hypothetical protein